jgi:hypothetical protein
MPKHRKETGGIILITVLKNTICTNNIPEILNFLKNTIRLKLTLTVIAEKKPGNRFDYSIKKRYMYKQYS